jgi:hypothetical protein
MNTGSLFIRILGKSDRRTGVCSRNASATSAIKRPFAAQIITDASYVCVLFFPWQSNFRLRFNIGRSLNPRWRFFWDFRTLYYKKGSARSNGRQMSREQLLFVLPCPLVCRNVFVRPAVSFSEFLAKDGENKAPRVDRRKEKRNFEHVHTGVDRKSDEYEILQRIEWIYRKSSSVRVLFFFYDCYRDNRGKYYQER